MKQLEAPIVQNDRLCSDIHRLTLYAPQIANHAKAGQFVNVKADVHTHDPLLRRPFSIHQTFSDGRFQIVFKVIGKGTSGLASLREGDTISIVGPLGNEFTIDDTMCLVGGGMGIAPMAFLTKCIVEKRGGAGLTVFLGARNRDEIVPLTAPFIECGITPQCATDDGSFGHHGLVTDLLAGLEGGRSRQIATCGPYPMMKRVAAISREKGWKCQVSMETMMACGIKACLGCTVPAHPKVSGARKYLHVCQDGPVFCEGAIEWK